MSGQGVSLYVCGREEGSALGWQTRPNPRVEFLDEWRKAAAATGEWPRGKRREAAAGGAAGREREGVRGNNPAGPIFFVYLAVCQLPLFYPPPYPLPPESRSPPHSHPPTHQPTAVPAPPSPSYSVQVSVLIRNSGHSPTPATVSVALAHRPTQTDNGAGGGGRRGAGAGPAAGAAGWSAGVGAGVTADGSGDGLASWVLARQVYTIPEVGAGGQARVTLMLNLR